MYCEDKWWSKTRLITDTDYKNLELTRYSSGTGLMDL